MLKVCMKNIKETELKELSAIHRVVLLLLLQDLPV